MEMDTSVEDTIKARAVNSYSVTGAAYALAYALLRAVETFDRKAPDFKQIGN